MVGILLKKQMSEIFRGYFFDTKKNKMRSRGSIAMMFVLYFLLMVGLLGGIFSVLAYNLCGPLSMVGVAWLYFDIMCGIAMFMGIFGSVFNTYSSLYIAKDNDLLLSMPIPVKTIMIARIMGVYIMGSMYSAVVLIPTIVIYWMVAGFTATNIIGGVLLFLVITTWVLILSCLLGWVVAKASLKLKNKSFTTVFISLGFIAAYYVVYFKASDIVKDIIGNAILYGEKVKGAAYGLYFFGKMGEGDIVSTAFFTAITVILFIAVFKLMSRSFLRIATASGDSKKVKYVERSVKAKSVFGAMLSKEILRFTSNSNYMLNCGLGVLLLPATGIFILIKGNDLCVQISKMFPEHGDVAAVVMCTLLFLVASMNDIAAPAVSLEGKSLWIPQSLPVSSKTVLRAKMSAQLLLTIVPMIIPAICVAVIIPSAASVKLLVFLMPFVFTVFAAMFDSVVGLKFPMMIWSNELTPIKQSGAVAIALFGGWAFAAVFGIVYLLVGYKIGALSYIACWMVLYAVVSLVMLRWLDTKGSREFSEL